MVTLVIQTYQKVGGWRQGEQPGLSLRRAAVMGLVLGEVQEVGVELMGSGQHLMSGLRERVVASMTCRFLS